MQIFNKSNIWVESRGHCIVPSMLRLQQQCTNSHQWIDGPPSNRSYLVTVLLSILRNAVYAFRTPRSPSSFPITRLLAQRDLVLCYTLAYHLGFAFNCPHTLLRDQKSIALLDRNTVPAQISVSLNVLKAPYLHPLSFLRDFQVL
jgi:hypothetical protein